MIKYFRIFVLLLIPLNLFADTIVIPSNGTGTVPQKTSTKKRAKKRLSKKRHKKLSRSNQGTGLSQEEVTDQREVSQQADLSGKDFKKK